MIGLARYTNARQRFQTAQYGPAPFIGRHPTPSDRCEYGPQAVKCDRVPIVVTASSFASSSHNGYAIPDTDFPKPLLYPQFPMSNKLIQRWDARLRKLGLAADRGKHIPKMKYGKGKIIVRSSSSAGKGGR